MFIEQISVFIENKKGRLAQVTKILSDNEVDIRALSIADTKDFGILRLIVNKPDIAIKVLKENELTVSITKVIAIGITDRPGGLSSAMSVLFENGIGVEYMYAFISRSDDFAYVILRVEDNQSAIDVLSSHDFKILEAEEIYDM